MNLATYSTPAAAQVTELSAVQIIKMLNQSEQKLAGLEQDLELSPNWVHGRQVLAQISRTLDTRAKLLAMLAACK